MDTLFKTCEKEPGLIVLAVLLSGALKQFTRVSEIEPQRNVNWMKTELVKWQLENDTIAEGILYKPENFDPQKKYPLIISVYEKSADELYRYKTPQLSDGGLDVAYFVSNGYLVFTPSIRYKVGEPGSSAATTIVSAARYLSRFSWVDSTSMALQGVSFGAYQVNYTITQTNYLPPPLKAQALLILLMGMAA